MKEQKINLKKLVVIGLLLFFFGILLLVVGSILEEALHPIAINIIFGLAIFYIYAQRLLGAARTSAYYAVAPFIGTALSLAIFQKLPQYTYFIALVLMAIGAWLSSQDKPLFKKKKEENKLNC